MGFVWLVVFCCFVWVFLWIHCILILETDKIALILEEFLMCISCQAGEDMLLWYFQKLKSFQVNLILWCPWYSISLAVTHFQFLMIQNTVTSCECIHCRGWQSGISAYTGQSSTRSTTIISLLHKHSYRYVRRSSHDPCSFQTSFQHWWKGSPFIIGLLLPAIWSQLNLESLWESIHSCCYSTFY